MSGRRAALTSGDVALLEAIGRLGSVVAAARELGMSRDRAVYRLGRLAAAFGTRLVAARRGGRGHGASALTALGDEIARGGYDGLELLGGRPRLPLASPNVLRGTYRVGPPATVVLDRGGAELRVAFDAREGERLGLLLEPEAILLARGRFASSARNVLPATVEGPGRRVGTGPRSLQLRVGPTRLRALVTDATVAELGIARGQRVYLYVKATALRPVAAGAGSSRPSRGPLRWRAKRPPRPRGGSASR